MLSIIVVLPLLSGFMYRFDALCLELLENVSFEHRLIAYSKAHEKKNWTKTQANSFMWLRNMLGQLCLATE